MGLGGLRAVSLADARKAAAVARKLVHGNIDPIAERDRVASTKFEANQPEAEDQRPTFGQFADDYVAKLHRAPKTLRNWRRTVEVHCVAIRHLRLHEIGISEIVSVVAPLIHRVPASGVKALTYLRKIMSAAKVMGFRAGDNPALWRGNLEHLILTTPKRLSARRHHMALPYAELPTFLAKLDLCNVEGSRALKFLILTATRTSEVVFATWSEIDLEKTVWTIPAKRMKMGIEHRVPLSQAAIALLKRVRMNEKPQPDEFVFPGRYRRPRLNLSSMTAMLKRMEIKDRSTVHGFRSTFRDWVGEQTQFSEVLAEVALGHKVGTDVERAYRRGDMLQKRFLLMEAWADFCEGRDVITERERLWGGLPTRGTVKLLIVKGAISS